ncbi:MAG: histidinol-phosphate transaminase [Eubacteriaceae bacterium]|nr:histidinol-phosphate transaminase [Eubacteriaceae bacterium]
MSRFLSSKYDSLVPYVPGEQPRDRKFIKLNTNESPFPPSPLAVEYAQNEAPNCRLYSDPELTELKKALCDVYGTKPERVIFSNGSDDMLNYAFMCFCDEEHPAAFADITYGLYSVLAALNRVGTLVFPLREDFTLDVSDYTNINATIFIANPNAPTGIALPVIEIERILSTNPDNVVVVDEAYVDFGAASVMKLTEKYENLLVIGTFSKSRSLAGARLGYACGNEELIKDIDTIRYSLNPYNVNRMTLAAGVGALKDDEYNRKNCAVIIENREYTMREMKALGFELTDSKANFVFARHPRFSGEYIYSRLREKGILVRHFSDERIKDHNRITIGTLEDMKELIKSLKEITEE